MYHARYKGNHYDAGYNWGRLLYKNKKIISENDTFIITNERKEFAKRCLALYEKFYPEILEEVEGLCSAQKISFEDMYTFLFSMYCFEFSNKCTCFAFKDENKIVLARNSDFLVDLEKLYMNCLYCIENAYSFNANTTAFIQMEDGINEYGMAIGLTFVYPKEVKPGLNAGMLVRYLLEKCRTAKEAIDSLDKLPIASNQTLTIADKTGEILVAECNSDKMHIIYPNSEGNFVVAVNNFNSDEMKEYRNPCIDDWKSDERYFVAHDALMKNRNRLSNELARDILSGKYGFMCQYDRKAGADTVWSVIYDIKNSRIFRSEGNPSRKSFKEDVRLKFKC